MEEKFETRVKIHHMDFIVKEGLGDKAWRVTGFYGWLELENMRLSWELLRELKNDNDLPWLCFGDFNAIMF